MRIYHGIQYADETEVESLLNDSKTDFNWTDLYVSVILYINR